MIGTMTPNSLVTAVECMLKKAENPVIDSCLPSALPRMSVGMEVKELRSMRIHLMFTGHLPSVSLQLRKTENYSSRSH